jgi:DNA-binding HxlR family transcriptional regulator
MQRKSLKAVRCPIARTLDIVGEWWTLLIIRDAFSGLTRFTEFQQNLGMAKNILSARLRKLVDEEILKLVPAADGSAYQEYALTEKGLSLFTVMAALRQWGESHLCDAGEIDVMLVDKKNHEPIRPIELRSQKGRVLGIQDLALIHHP